MKLKWYLQTLVLHLSWLIIMCIKLSLLCVYNIALCLQVQLALCLYHNRWCSDDEFTEEIKKWEALKIESPLLLKRFIYPMLCTIHPIHVHTNIRGHTYSEEVGGWWWCGGEGFTYVAVLRRITCNHPQWTATFYCFRTSDWLTVSSHILSHPNRPSTLPRYQTLDWHAEVVQLISASFIGLLMDIKLLPIHCVRYLSTIDSIPLIDWPISLSLLVPM